MVAAQNSKAQFNSNIAFRTKAACRRAVLLLQPQGRTVCIRMSASHFDWRGTLFAQTAFSRRSTGKRRNRCHALEYVPITQLPGRPLRP
jgi:hypothetical protein